MGGLRKDSLLGSATGVYVGVWACEYAAVLRRSAAGRSVYAATASACSVVVGRLSFALGLQGPCMSYDTACSSSLAALHGGLRALQHAECTTALVAGVNMIFDPSVSLAEASAGMTSAGGRCHTFDARADGYVRGEACSAMALQLASEAAVGSVMVRGSAVRQDGRSASLTAPNGMAQRALLQAALAEAGVAAASVARLEAHGTGTALGDPIEAGSLRAAMLQARDEAQEPLAVSSVKANCGHRRAGRGDVGALGACGRALTRAGGAECAAAAAQSAGGRGSAGRGGVCAADGSGGDEAIRRGLAGGRRVVVRVQRHDCARAAAECASHCCVGRGRRRGGPLPSARVHVGHWCGGCARQLGGRSVQRGLGGAGRGRRSHGVVAWRPVARGAARGRAGRCGAVDACGRACERAAGERAAWQRVHRALVARRGAAAGRGGRRGAVRAWRAVCGAPCAAAVPHGAAAAAGAADQRCCCGAVRCGRGCSVGRGARRQLGLRARAAPRAAGGACAERRRVARRVRCGGRGFAAFGGGIVGRRRRR